METKKKTSLFKGVKLFWHDLYITITYINLSILKTAEDGEGGIRSVIGYARVSSATQKDDLERQIEYLRQRGVQEIIADVGSGLNERRKGFLKLLDKVLHNEVDKVVILYEDRLTRFGFDTLKRVFEVHGTSIDVLNQVEMKSPQQELVDDLITIISHFAGRMYGLRSRKHKEVVECAKNLFAQA